MTSLVRGAFFAIGATIGKGFGMSRTMRHAIRWISVLREPNLRLGLLVRVLCLALALGVAPALLAGPASAANVQSSAKAAASGDEPLTRPDSVSAMATARATDKRVEDLSQRTVTDQVFANPDGTWTSESAPEPVRVQDKGTGAWKDIDTTLEPVPGGFAPKTSLGDLVVSDGGDAALASLDVAGRPLGWKWPTTLPTPIIDGNTATYPNVVENGDLVVTATATGFSQDIVLRQAPTEPLVIKTPIVTSGPAVAEQSNGTLAVTTKDGDELVTAPAPVMFDASEDTSGQPDNTAPIDVQVTKTASGGTVTMTPDQEFLTDPTTQYPVTIDPSYGQTEYAYSDTWVYNTSPTAYHPYDDELIVGTNNSGSTKYRSFVQFGQGTWDRGRILGATMYMRNFETLTCGSSTSTVYVQRLVAAFQGMTTWNNQPTGTSTGQAVATAGYGKTGCATAEDMTWNVTAIVQAWADHSAPNYGVRVFGSPETSNSTYRKFRSIDYAYQSTYPRLAVTYDRYPGTPTSFVISGRTGSWLNTTGPTLSAAVTDPDGGTVYARYNIYNSAGTLVSTGTGNGVASGGISTWKAPAGTFANGQNYTVRVFGYDGTVYTGNGATTAGPPLSFTVDTTAPTVAVTASAYTNGQWLDNAPASNTFTLDGDADVVNFKVEKDGVASTLAATSGDATLSWNPANGGHSLKVTAIDRAGNNSAAFTFSFGNGTAVLNYPVDADRSSTTFPIQASAPPGASSAKIQWRFAPAASQGSTPDPEAGWVDASALSSGGGSWAGTVSTDSSGASATPTLIWDPHAEAGSPISSTALVEVRVVFAYPGGAYKRSPLRRVQVVPHAFGGSFPTEDVGPGQVGLYTGEMQVNEGDVSVPGFGGDLTLARSSLSMAATASGPAGVYGPGWKADLTGPDEGVGGLTVVDHTATDGSITLLSQEGDTFTFRHSSGTSGAQQVGSYLGVGDAALSEGTLTLASATGQIGISHRLTLTENDGTKTIWVRSTAGSTPTWVTEQVVGPEDNSSTTYAHDAEGRVTWIFAPSPSGVTCDATLQQPGCRALHLNYSDIPIGSSTDKRLTSIELRIFNPHTAANGLPGSGAGMDTITVAKYAYNGAGQLSDAWDPRVADGAAALKTNYTYDTAGPAGNTHTVLKTMTQPGMKTWTFDYDTSGRLAAVRRPQDSAVGGADAKWTVRYGLDRSGGGLPDLTPSATATWGQPAADAPVDGAAVWGPDCDPSASACQDDYEYATLSYWTQSGRQTNSAVYGAGAWQVNSTRYDSHGNSIWALDAAGRNQALAEGSPTAGDKYATLTVYDNAGTRVEEEWSPTRDFVLKNGDEITGRHLTQTIYDDEPGAAGYIDGRPTTDVPDGGFNLPVRVLDSSTDKSGPGADGTLFDTTETRYRYDPVQPGDGDGWVLSTPTRVLIQDGSGWSTTVTRFDDAGRVFQSKTPAATASSGSAAAVRTTDTSYYTADTSSSRPECRNRPEWAGLMCWHGPDGTPSSGAAVPDGSVLGYSTLLKATRIVQASGGASRTSVVGYDASGRISTSSVATSGLTPSDRPVLDTATSYSPSTGQPVVVTNGNASITTAYDSWGRQISQTDGTGNTATTSYDGAGRVATENDGKGTYAYTYNGTDSSGKKERRGLVTSLDVDLPSGPDTFTGSYDANGVLSEENYPGGVTASWDRDLDGTPVALTYSQAGTDLLSFSQQLDDSGRVRLNDGPQSNQVYKYDDENRLTETRDSSADGCTVRDYGFSDGSDRNSLKSYVPDSDGSCETTGTPSSTTWSFDDADRNTSTGYSYDSLGRTTLVPAGDTTSNLDSPGTLAIGYTANDMVATLSQSGMIGGVSTSESQDFGLDVTGRISTISSMTNGVQLNQSILHYAGGDDSPAWTDDKTRPDGSFSWSSSWTRNITGLDDSLGLIQTSSGGVALQLSNLHGDVVSTLPVGGVGIASYSEYDEFGNAAHGASGVGHYTWLGSAMRQAGTVGGLTLMGARLYNPRVGAFLTRDQVENGNTTTYTYPQDPVNADDVDGRAYCIKEHEGQCHTQWATYHTVHAPTEWYSTDKLYGNYGFNSQDDDDTEIALGVLFPYASVLYYKLGYEVYNNYQIRWQYVSTSGYTEKYQAHYRILVRTVIHIYARMRVRVVHKRFWVILEHRTVRHSYLFGTTKPTTYG